MCHSNCQLSERPSYVWFHSGRTAIGQTFPSISVSPKSENSFACAVRGHEEYSSPSVCEFTPQTPANIKELCHYVTNSAFKTVKIVFYLSGVGNKTCVRVTYTHRSICAPRGSSVDISCVYSSPKPPQTHLWFSPERSHEWRTPSQPEDLGDDSLYTGRVRVQSGTGNSTLTITDLRDSDSAQYHFKFKARFNEWGIDFPGTDLVVTGTDEQTKVMCHISQDNDQSRSVCLATLKK